MSRLFDLPLPLFEAIALTIGLLLVIAFAWLVGRIERRQSLGCPQLAARYADTEAGEVR